MARIGALVAQAREEAIQGYMANFKDTDDYLDLMRGATKEYKSSLKKVNPDFDAEYYDRLILRAEEPQTPAPKDPVGFDQLHPIRIPETAADPSALGEEAVASTSQAPVQLADPPANQSNAPATAQPTNPATA